MPLAEVINHAELIQPSVSYPISHKIYVLTIEETNILEFFSCILIFIFISLGIDMNQFYQQAA